MNGRTAKRLRREALGIDGAYPRGKHRTYEEKTVGMSAMRVTNLQRRAKQILEEEEEARSPKGRMAMLMKKAGEAAGKILNRFSEIRVQWAEKVLNPDTQHTAKIFRVSDPGIRKYRAAKKRWKTLNHRERAAFRSSGLSLGDWLARNKNRRMVEKTS